MPADTPHIPSSPVAGRAPAILSPQALFERQCVLMDVTCDPVQRKLLEHFFFAGMEAATPAAGPAQVPPAHLVDDGFDAARSLRQLRTNLDRQYGPRPAAGQ